MSSQSNLDTTIDLVSDDEVNRSNDSVIILEQDSGIVVEEGEEGDQDQKEAPVVVQDGVLTLAPLISEVRVRIKKRKLEEEEVAVEAIDDHIEEDQGKKKRVLTGVRWTGESVRT